jgi:enhancing lycopene biosynthesis protein 2
MAGCKEKRGWGTLVLHCSLLHTEATSLLIMQIIRSEIPAMALAYVLNEQHLIGARGGVEPLQQFDIADVTSIAVPQGQGFANDLRLGAFAGVG